jgi:tellurite resistance protein TerC
MLALDLGLFHRGSGTVRMKEALMRSAAWIGLSLAFCAGVWWLKGSGKALEFLTGYLIEYSLSVDNIFVFVLLFTYFKVSPAYQHKVLFWGIIGALVMRAILIYAGVELIHRFEWLMVVFGAFLVFTGLKLAFQKEDDMEPHENPVVRGFKKLMPVTHEYHGDKFFVMQEENGVMRRFATPLFIVLLMVETTDLIFALDSIPAIIGISQDMFIVYTSNVFAILGLRSLYFAVAGLMGLFRHLKMGLSVILMFVGIKMLLSYWHIKIPIVAALAVIILVLTVSIIWSIMTATPEEKQKARDAMRNNEVPEPELTPEQEETARETRREIGL